MVEATQNIILFVIFFSFFHSFRKNSVKSKNSDRWTMKNAWKMFFIVKIDWIAFKSERNTTKNGSSCPWKKIINSLLIFCGMKKNINFTQMHFMYIQNVYINFNIVFNIIEIFLRWSSFTAVTFVAIRKIPMVNTRATVLVLYFFHLFSVRILWMWISVKIFYD